MTTRRSPRSRPVRAPAGAAAREAALAALLAGEPGERGIAGFLDPLSALVPFDWAAIVEPGAPGGARARSWSRRGGPEDGFASEENAAGEELAAAGAKGGARELRDPILMAPFRARGIHRVFRVEVPMGPEAVPEGRTALLLGRRDDRPFGAREVKRAEALWPPLGRALLRLGKQEAAEAVARERASELAALFEIVRAAGRARGFEDLFAGLAAALRPPTGAEAIGFLLDLEGNSRLLVYLGAPVSGEFADGFRARCLEAFEREAGRRPAPGAEPVRRLPDFDPEAIRSGDRPELFAAAALRRRGRCAGVVAVGAGRGRTRESLQRLLAAAAGQASIAVDRLQSVAEAQAQRLSALIDSLSDGVILTDRDFRVETSNAAAAGYLRLLTGRDPDAPEGGPLVLRDLGGVSIPDAAREVLDGRRDAVGIEVRLPAPGRILRLAITPLAGRPGAVDGLVLLISDLTEARALREQMLQTEKLSALGEMLSGIAHELNNPLASVMGYSQLLQSARVGSDVRRKLELIYSEARRCQSIVRNLLFFARKHPPERRLLSVNEVLESVLALLTYHLRAGGIEVRTELDRALPPVMGDFHQLQQVFLNLISNAHHAMQDGAGQKRLVVRSGREGGRVRVEIGDTGPGMKAAVLERVFEPFFTTKEPGRGTGLGLSIAAGTVSAHGGSIRAESVEGEGSNFRVELPAVEAGAVLRTPRGAEAPVRGTPSRHILVVEDETAVQGLLREALCADGHRVDTAADGVEARERLARRDYDLIITDLRMPREGGRELYESLIATRPDLARRFIFATGDVASAEAREFVERTGRPVLAKPFDVLDLRQLVRESLGEG